MAILMDIERLSVEYPGARHHRAVREVSLSVMEGECLGLVGGSGSGKTTLVLALLGLLPAAEGVCRFRGEDLRGLRGDRLRRFRRDVQIVFQDPLASLNPRLTIGDTLEEVLTVHRLARGRAARRARVAELLRMVHLDPVQADRFPHEFSGGQRQRIGIARALAVEPRLLVADEPVSALDVSVQAQILNLFKELRERLGLSLVLVAHDLAVVRYMADRVAVMRHGRLVEYGPADRLFEQPSDAYTRVLLDAVPDLDRRLAAGAAPGSEGVDQQA